MKKALVIICTLAILSAGCSLLNGSNEALSPADIEGELSIDLTDKMPGAKTVEGEIKFYPTYDANYKTCKNDILEIWFDIPVQWSAADESHDGMEYRIITGNNNVSLRVYGVTFEGTAEEFYSSLKGQAGTVADFILRDGSSGKRIDVSENEVYFTRPDGDSYVVFHVREQGDGSWIDENSETIEYIAMSIRTTRESYGSSLEGNNQVTLEDLQLGDIKLGITYDELLELLENESDESIEVSEDEYEGLVAKTLYLPDDTQILVVDGTVHSVNVISPDYPTPRGLKVGDSEETLLELYGEPASIDDNYWNYTYEGYELFTVKVEDSKVTEMQIDLAM